MFIRSNIATTRHKKKIPALVVRVVVVVEKVYGAVVEKVYGEVVEG